MKKLFPLLAFGIILLTSSCHIFDGSTTVVNNSTHSVSFVFGGHLETLEPGESVSIGYSFVRIRNLEPNTRVHVSYIDENNREIVNLPSFVIRAENRTLATITLSAGGWLENNLTIPSGGGTVEGRIFTRTPNFTATAHGTQFPVIVNYRFVGNVLYVAIH